MFTGYHMTASAEVNPRNIVMIVDDGVIGLCGIIAANLSGSHKDKLSWRSRPSGSRVWDHWRYS